jgi:hypothetical protein
MSGRFTLLLHVLGSATLGGSTVSCWRSCPRSIGDVPPEITVTDAVTGRSICDATVISLPDGANTEAGLLDIDAGTELRSYPAVGDAGTDCTWNPPVTIGAFTLVVSKTGYRTTTARGTWHWWGGCSGPDSPPAPDKINVRLTPG